MLLLAVLKQTEDMVLNWWVGTEKLVLEQFLVGHKFFLENIFPTIIYWKNIKIESENMTNVRMFLSLILSF